MLLVLGILNDSPEDTEIKIKCDQNTIYFIDKIRTLFGGRVVGFFFINRW